MPAHRSFDSVVVSVEEDDSVHVTVSLKVVVVGDEYDDAVVVIRLPRDRERRILEFQNHRRAEFLRAFDRDDLPYRRRLHAAEKQSEERGFGECDYPALIIARHEPTGFGDDDASSIHGGLE